MRPEPDRSLALEAERKKRHDEHSNEYALTRWAIGHGSCPHRQAGAKRSEAKRSEAKRGEETVDVSGAQGVPVKPDSNDEC